MTPRSSPPVDTTGPLLLVYIDVNDNGVCDMSDPTAAASTEWNGDFAMPVWQASIAPPLTPATFVCASGP